MESCDNKKRIVFYIPKIQLDFLHIYSFQWSNSLLPCSQSHVFVLRIKWTFFSSKIKKLASYINVIKPVKTSERVTVRQKLLKMFVFINVSCICYNKPNLILYDFSFIYSWSEWIWVFDRWGVDGSVLVQHKGCWSQAGERPGWSPTHHV